MRIVGVGFVSAGERAVARVVGRVWALGATGDVGFVLISERWGDAGSLGSFGPGVGRARALGSFHPGWGADRWTVVGFVLARVGRERGVGWVVIERGRVGA